MPEMPEVQAHAERLTAELAGLRLRRFVPLTFTALKTASPSPALAEGTPLREVGRRGKYLLVTFDAVTFVVHLMQGGRLLVDDKQAAKPRGGQARFTFTPTDDRPAPPALLLTEQGSERRAGVWCVATEVVLDSPPLDKLGPEAATIGVDELAARFATLPSTRLHGWLRDQRAVAGIGRRLANEVCHRARLSPFAMTRKLDRAAVEAVVAAIGEAVAEGLEEERARPDMSSSKDRPSRVHGRTGELCPVCGDTVRAVEYSSYTVNYCPTCQTAGKVLADNTTSKFLR
jgi:formamidopyrimidine-DNA glycosylase